MDNREITTRPFSEELPRILAEHELTLRALAREVGGFDHGYLSRMLAGRTRVNPTHVEQISRYLGYPDDYFGEVREARTIEAIRKDPSLRDDVYFGLMGGKGSRARRSSKR